jgi:hypothetical protein
MWQMFRRRRWVRARFRMCLAAALRSHYCRVACMDCAQSIARAGREMGVRAARRTLIVTASRRPATSPRPSSPCAVSGIPSRGAQDFANELPCDDEEFIFETEGRGRRPERFAGDMGGSPARTSPGCSRSWKPSLVHCLEIYHGKRRASSFAIWPPTTRVCIGSTRACRDVGCVDCAHATTLPGFGWLGKWQGTQRLPSDGVLLRPETAC